MPQKKLTPSRRLMAAAHHLLLRWKGEERDDEALPILAADILLALTDPVAFVRLMDDAEISPLVRGQLRAECSDDVYRILHTIYKKYKPLATALQA